MNIIAAATLKFCAVTKKLPIDNPCQDVAFNINETHSQLLLFPIIVVPSLCAIINDVIVQYGYTDIVTVLL
jgi:hypothetical protein